MSKMKYLTPKKSLSEIYQERAEQAEAQNIDIYEAIAGLYEEMANLASENEDLKARLEKLEGGTK